MEKNKILQKYLKQIRSLKNPSRTDVKLILSNAKECVDDYFLGKDNGSGILNEKDELELKNLTREIWKEAHDLKIVPVPIPNNIKDPNLR